APFPFGPPVASGAGHSRRARLDRCYRADRFFDTCFPWPVDRRRLVATACLKASPGANEGTSRAGTGPTISGFFGLRATRLLRLRFSKVPNPTNDTRSPRATASLITSMVSSSIFATSALLRSVRFATSATRLLLFTGPLRSSWPRAVLVPGKVRQPLLARNAEPDPTGPLEPPDTMAPTTTGPWGNGSPIDSGSMTAVHWLSPRRSGCSIGHGIGPWGNGSPVGCGPTSPGSNPDGRRPCYAHAFEPC